MAPDLQRKVDEARRYRLEKEAELRGQVEAQVRLPMSEPKSTLELINLVDKWYGYGQTHLGQ